MGYRAAPDTTLAKIQVDAEQGDPDAQALLGVIYSEGVGVAPEDAALAAHWYQKSAEQGHLEAQLILGGMYLEGQGVAPDSAEGIRWIEKAANRHSGPAQLVLGSVYILGKGVEKNLVTAYMWLDLARENGEEEDAQEGIELLGSLLSSEQIIEAEQQASAWRKKHPRQSP